MKRAIALILCVVLQSGCGQREMLPPSRTNHSPERIENPEVRRVFTEAIAALNELREKYPHLREAKPELYVGSGAVSLRMRQRMYYPGSPRAPEKSDLAEGGVLFALSLHNPQIVPGDALVWGEQVRLPSLSMLGQAKVLVPEGASKNLESQLQTIMDRMIDQLQAVKTEAETGESPPRP